MAYITSSRPAPFGAIVTLKMVNAFDRFVELAKTAYMTRKTESLLDHLSDHQLEDIGVSRSQINTTTMEMVARRHF